MPAPRDRDGLLTGACLALAGVVVGAVIAWALLRARPGTARAPVILVPTVAAPVAQVDPRKVTVHPSSAFTPVSGNPRPTGATPARTDTTAVPVNDAREPADPPTAGRLDLERTSPSQRPKIFVAPGVNPALPVPAPGQPTPGTAQISDIDDALSYALEGIDPYLKRGYHLREDTWGGDLPVGRGQAIPHQLFKGNEYRFCIGTSGRGTRVSVHVYDEDGAFAERGLWPRFAPKGDGDFAGAVVHPMRTGTYFIVVAVESSPTERTAWGMVYAYK